MEKAIMVGGVAINHTKAIFQLMGTDPDIANAVLVLDWIKREKKKQISQRDCFNRFRAIFTRVASMKSSLRVLEERSYIRDNTQKTGRRGRPSPSYEVNPYIFE